MEDKEYTILDFSEKFRKDKQLIRRKLSKLGVKAINKDTREYNNEPLQYDYKAYIELAKSFGLSHDIREDHENETQNNTQQHTSDTPNDTQQHTDSTSKNRLIEVLERELEHAKSMLEKAEREKDNLYRLLSQQQQLSLNDKSKIKLLELKLEDADACKNEETEQEFKGVYDSKVEVFEDENKEHKKAKWYDIFKRNKQ